MTDLLFGWGDNHVDEFRTIHFKTSTLTFQEICHQRSWSNTESAVANKRAKKQVTGASSATITLFGLIYVEYGFGNLVFVADQFGHSLQMLIKQYAKWIHADKNRIEMAKLNTTNGT